MNEPSPFDAIREFEFDGTSYQMANLTVLEEEGVSVNSTSSPSVSAFSSSPFSATSTGRR